MNRQELITVLYEFGLGEIKPRCISLGICDQILLEFDSDFIGELQSVFRKWPEFSGNIAFPVPSMRYGISEDVAYIRNSDLWAGSYGAARRRLCVFLADQLTLNQEENK